MMPVLLLFQNWLLFENLAAWMAQIGVLVAIGAIAALTLAPGRARLVFWQGLLAVAMLLPAIQPWTRPAAEDSTTGATAISSTMRAAPRNASHSFQKEDLLWIVALGAAARSLWIGIGFLRLRGHRLAARRLAEPPVPFENLGIRWYVSETISGPVTFGWMRPSILLPSRVCALPADLREAIACHEMVHVRRGDWLFVLAEEALRAVFWFHPAVWLALSRIQLAREQAVDFEVVRLMGNRERYLDALVAVAAQKFERVIPSAYAGSDIAPAPLFLKQRQLAVRVAAVLKEKRMSKSRAFAGFATVSTAALIAARLAVWVFPLQSPEPSFAQAPVPAAVRSTSPDSPGIEVDPGAPLMHRTGVGRPFGVTTTGTVVLDASVDQKGEVTDAHVISGPEELRRFVLQSVLQWHYSTDGGLGPSVRVVVNFGVAPPIASSSQSSSVNVTASRNSTQSPAVLKDIQFMGASPELAQKVTSALPVHVGDSVGPENMGQILAAAHEIDEHFTANMTYIDNSGVREAILRLTVPGSSLSLPAPGGGVVRGVAGGVTAGISDAAPAGPIVAYRNGVALTQSDVDSQSAPQRIRVGGNVQQVNLLRRVQPVYPPLAKQAGIQGTVSLTAVIGRDGTVENLQVVSGHPVLVPAALDAVKQWAYKPTLLNGNPVEVITQIDVNFTLAP